MFEGLGIYLQPLVSAGNIVTWALILGAGITWWIRGAPERQRAKNEEKVIDYAQVALRFKEWRAEVHAMKNELAVVRAELHLSNSQRQRNKERFNMVLFILRLVMEELRRIDPSSKVISQAEGLLKTVCEATDADNEEDKSPEGAVASARATVAQATDTLDQLENGDK